MIIKFVRVCLQSSRSHARTRNIEREKRDNCPDFLFSTGFRKFRKKGPKNNATARAEKNQTEQKTQRVLKRKENERAIGGEIKRPGGKTFSLRARNEAKSSRS